ncbi:hypothetical protein HGA91_00065 [candidate division WWE3 bacterium]|nr:hypothetical protein [candidate division WWE3 bacterium]
MPKQPKKTDLEFFEELWGDVPQEEVWPASRPKGYSYFGVAFKAGRWRAISMLVIGPRGGLSERLIIVDDEEPYDPHKVKLNYTSAEDDGIAYGLSGLRHCAPDREGRLLIARRAVEEIAEQVKTKSRDWEQVLGMFAEMWKENTCVSAFRGGLPGLGSSHR